MQRQADRDRHTYKNKKQQGVCKNEDFAMLNLNLLNIVPCTKYKTYSDWLVYD